MKVGILGGSFDPPHLGHQILALCALALEDIDALWVIPCADHPFSKKLSTFDHRMEMCRLAFGSMDKRVKIVDIERTLPGPSYTVQTLEAIRKKQPAASLTFIMGSDVYLDLPKWREPERIAQLCQLAVFLRQGGGKIDPAQNPYQARVHNEFVLPHVKSTLIRDSLRSGISQSAFVDRRVLKYVNEQKLYS